MADAEKKRRRAPERPRASEGQAAGLPHRIDHECLDLCPICRTADVLRATVPPEVQEHWHAWQREALLAVRAMLDHYLEGLEGKGPRGVAVEDIEIE